MIKDLLSLPYIPTYILSASNIMQYKVTFKKNQCIFGFNYFMKQKVINKTKEINKKVVLLTASLNQLLYNIPISFNLWTVLFLQYEATKNHFLFNVCAVTIMYLIFIYNKFQDLYSLSLIFEIGGNVKFYSDNEIR